YHVKHTLKKMADGGIYDHLGGSFHRYSVDKQWLIPHFEKMLYDNSQLINLYLEAYQTTGDESFKDIAVNSLTYIQREMLSPEGGFYSTQDADIEGEEGKFFVWTPYEVIDVLGEEIGSIFCRYYDVTNHGNFEGKNILHTDISLEVIAEEFHKPPEEVDHILKNARHKMFLSREKRGKPFRDEKILTSWNALMISAVVKAYNILGDMDYLKMGRECTDFILRNLFKNNRLLSNYKDGAAKLSGYLDDYAFFAAALLDLYEATFESTYLEKANLITNIMLEQFWDESGDGGFYFTGDDHEPLITRTKSGYDHSIPSGNAIAAMDLLRLYHLMDSNDYLIKAEQILRLFYQPSQENPFGYASMFSALDFYLERPKEIMVSGKKESHEVVEMLRQIHKLYLPNKTITFVDTEQTKKGRLPSILRGKTLKGDKLTVYVCHNFTCSMPVTEWADLKELLLSK
ncbi:MAG TPA: thioredoxin domain-containing protein, partial [Thermodesulfovibrionales bacterium]|nr:thioredoxin domain-containing protein [Thermodesulfovibrionales bacterium]